MRLSKKYATGHYGYVMEMGKVVLDGECDKLRENEDVEDVKEFYLGLTMWGTRRVLRTQSITSEGNDGFPKALTIKEPADA